MNLIDIGANLTHDTFDPDRDAVLERARSEGITRLVITGSSDEDSQKALELAKRHPGLLYATAGIHPHHAADFGPDTLQLLETLCRHPEVVAVGECGLDFFRNYSPRDAQESAFAAQLELGRRTGKPLFLHQREAHERLLGILKEAGNQLPRAVVHCFTDGVKEANDCLDRDLYIGITGWICDERRGHHLRDVVRLIPADRLMVETDAPYLLPRDIHPKPASRRNEPMHLPHVVRAIASAVGKPPEQVAEETTAVAERFFALDGRAAMSS